MRYGTAFFAATILAAVSVVLPTRGTAQERRVEVTIAPGSEWSHVKWFGPARVTLTPQLALWIQDEAGNYIGDLFITRKTGKSAWGKARRPDALPVWSHARGVRYADGLYMPTPEEPLPDAVTAVTPKADRKSGTVGISAIMPAGLGPGRVQILAEINNSFDYNDTFGEKNSGVNGQPSVVYAAWLDLTAGKPTENVVLAHIGTGHPVGTDGTISAGRNGLTTALEIVREIAVSIR